MMEIAHEWRVVGLALLSVAFLTGCGTLRGRPPSFTTSPGSIGTVSRPYPPAALPDAHLRKRLQFTPQANTLQNVDVKSDDPNIIFFPRLRLMTEDEVVRTPPFFRGDLLNDKPMPVSEGSFLAILDLKNESAQAAASGRLAADFLYRAVRRKKNNIWDIRVVDRDNAFSLLYEETKIPTNFIGHVDDGIWKATKDFKYTTYWITGAVTTFSLENKELQFDYTLETNALSQFKLSIQQWKAAYKAYADQYNAKYIPAYRNYLAEFQRRRDELEQNYNDYSRRYQTYWTAYASDYTPRYQKYTANLQRQAALGNLLFLPVHLGLAVISLGKSDTFAKAIPAPPVALMPKQLKPSLGDPEPQVPFLNLENAIPKRDDPEALMSVFRANRQIPNPVSKMATVCNVGITLRLVEGRTSDIIWIGNGSVRSTDLQIGMQELCDKLISEMMHQVRTQNE